MNPNVLKLIVLLPLLVTWSSLVAQPASSESTISVDQTADPHPLNIHVNSGGKVLWADSNALRLKEGTLIEVAIDVPCDGFISLYQRHEPTGKVTRIFPRPENGRSTEVKKGAQFAFPALEDRVEMAVSWPFGPCEIVATITGAPTERGDALPDKNALLAEGVVGYDTYPDVPESLRVDITRRDERTALVLPLVVGFQVGSAIFAGEENLALVRVVAQAMNSTALRRMHLRVQGHADSAGSSMGNIALSELRAKAVAKALVSYGVARHRLVVEGRGHFEPAVDWDGPETDASNRRVEMRLFEASGAREKLPFEPK